MKHIGFLLLALLQKPAQGCLVRGVAGQDLIRHGEPLRSYNQGWLFGV